MIELLIIALSVFTLINAATKPKRRRAFPSHLRIVRITSSSAIGALASLDVVANAIISTSANRYRAISFNCSYSWASKAEIDDAASFGFAHSDYTDAEIEECLEAATAISQGDKVAQERANRLVRQIGTMAGVSSIAAGGAQFNNGMKVKTRLNWLMGIGSTVQLWVRNSSGAVYTTGSTITINGELLLSDKA